MREGTIVDATLIAAPPSTKNKDKTRDPDMHQSKKGNDWHFGMKAHIGVDAASGLVHTVIGTAGNVSDVTQAHALLHGDEIAALARKKAWRYRMSSDPHHSSTYTFNQQALVDFAQAVEALARERCAVAAEDLARDAAIDYANGTPVNFRSAVGDPIRKGGGT